MGKIQKGKGGKMGGLRELHLFSGAGGGILGGYLLGHRCVCAVEIEEYPRKVLIQRQLDGILPKFPIWDDITTFDGKPWKGVVDVVCGGFPCQDISCAGKGAGIEGERSGLWGEMSRVIDEIRPQYAFVENSPMLTSRGLGRVLGDLAEMGYNARWGVLGADHTGLYHHRHRLWILAYSSSKPGSRNRKVFTRDSRKEKERRDKKIRSADRIKFKKRTRFFTPMEAWRNVGEPSLVRMDDELAVGMDRLKSIGNGQVPRVAELAWRILKGE